MFRSLINLIAKSIRFVCEIGIQSVTTVGITIIRPALMGCVSSLEIDTPVKKRKPIPRRLRDEVWITYYGNVDVGNCYCCDARINRYNNGWHCGHVIADSKKGTLSLDNLRPCCVHCNLSMGDQNLYAYIQSKALKGRGAKNINAYFNCHPAQKGDRRTVNYGKRTIHLNN